MPAKLRQILAWWQLIFGALALFGLVVGYVFEGGFRSTVARTVFAITVFALSAVAGWRLRRGTADGRRLSLVVQGLQVVLISGPTVVFQFGCGPWIMAYQREGHVGVSPWLGAFAQLGRGTAASPREVSVNLLALAVVILLLRWQPAAPAASPVSGASSPLPSAP